MEFEQQFPNDAACLDYLVQTLYPNGIFCPKCQKVTKHHRNAKRPSYSCQYCGHHEHPMVGTIFQDSATSLKLWMYAIYLMSSTRCGISAKQLERELGVTYKTAWRMFNKIRSLMTQDPSPLFGRVEMDETYFGPRGSRGGRPAPGGSKVPVLGMAQRKWWLYPGRVAATVVPDISRDTLRPHFRARILPKAIVYTDELPVYNKLRDMGFRDSRIHHSQKVYARGDVHTNTVEGFWALLKNGISGVYHGVSTKHLQAYLDEYAFRYNNRTDPKGVFNVLLGRVRKAVS
ncbi:MAG TPA: IS1595 family transposase [bacterium]|nr:IS1595 family transposase [bacterium]